MNKPYISVVKNRIMGRPPTKPVTFRDGFYIEVLEKGATRGIKIRSNTEQEMLETAELYRRSRNVLVLGQMKKGVWLNELANKAERKAKPAADKAMVKTIAKPVAKTPEPKKEKPAAVKETAKVKATAKPVAKPAKKVAAKKK